MFPLKLVAVALMNPPAEDIGTTTLMGALPLGWGGFGAREAAAVVVLGAVGAAPGEATAAALLYGLSAVLQGVLSAPLFLAAGGRRRS